MTAIPSVIWRKIDYHRSDYPRTDAMRLYLRSDRDLKSWSTRKADAHVFGTKTEAIQVSRRLRHPATTVGVEAAGPACPACGGPSRWVDTFWVCNACGDEFTDDEDDER